MKILLFDFDGTIADTLDPTLRIYNEIAREQHFRIITKEDMPLLRSLSARDAARRFGIPLFRLPFIAQRVRAGLKHELPTLQAIPGIPEALRSLKTRGYALSIVSSNAEDTIHDFLIHNDIDLFDDVYAVLNLFGKGTKIHNLVKTNHWDPSNVLYIGDEVRDIDAAKKAGIRSVAVTWGHNTEDALVKHAPDFLMRVPAELLTL